MPETIVSIIPLYNGAKYIRPAIESIFAQERQPDEIVVVDDGSTDNGEGAAVVSELTDPRIKLLFKENGGQGSARNFGVQNSTSSLIAFLDQDDLWYPHHLRVLEKPFLDNKSPPLGWAYSNLDQINADGSIVCQSVLSKLGANEHPKRTINCCLGQDMYILPGASLISRTAYESVGGFDPQFSGYEDDDLFLRMFCKGWRNEYIDKPLTIWRTHAESSSLSQRMATSRAKYFEKLVQTFPNNADMNQYYVSEFIAPRFVPNALFDLYIGIKRKDPAKIDLAREHLKRFSRALPISRRLKIRAIGLVATLPPIRWILRLLPKSIVMAARPWLYTSNGTTKSSSMRYPR
jgi:glycosyltransferase involved in cell wall biosynthesis